MFRDPINSTNVPVPELLEDSTVGDKNGALLGGAGENLILGVCQNLCSSKVTHLEGPMRLFKYLFFYRCGL